MFKIWILISPFWVEILYSLHVCAKNGYVLKILPLLFTVKAWEPFGHLTQVFAPSVFGCGHSRHP
jgi:hypothetical protein